MEKLKSIYIDCPMDYDIRPDDFVVSIGKTKTNSVYHVYESRAKPKPEKDIIRFYLKVFDSDLISVLIRDKSYQRVILLHWYPR